MRTALLTAPKWLCPGSAGAGSYSHLDLLYVSHPKHTLVWKSLQGSFLCFPSGGDASTSSTSSWPTGIIVFKHRLFSAPKATQHAAHTEPQPHGRSEVGQKAVVWLPEGPHLNFQKEKPQSPKPWQMGLTRERQQPGPRLKKPEAGPAQEASGKLSCTGCLNKPAAVLEKQSTACTEE